MLLYQVWIRQMLMSAFLLPTLVCGTAFLVNFIAIYYHASRSTPIPNTDPPVPLFLSSSPAGSGSSYIGILFRAIPFGTMVAVSCICLFVILPLTLVGSVLGRNLAGEA